MPCPKYCLPNHHCKSCPAKDAKCHKCCVAGHYRSACKNPKKKRTKKVHEVQNEEKEVGPFLKKICVQGGYWSTQVKVDGFLTDFKLDELLQ